MIGKPRNAMVCAMPYLQNEFGDPRFFYVFNLILSFSTGSQGFKKICVGEVFGCERPLINLCTCSKDTAHLLKLNLDFLKALKVTKSSHHLSHDQASKGHGSIPCLM